MNIPISFLFVIFCLSISILSSSSSASTVPQQGEIENLILSNNNKRDIDIVFLSADGNTSSTTMPANASTSQNQNKKPPPEMSWKSWTCVGAVLFVLIVLFAEIASCSATMFLTTLFFVLCGILDTKEFLSGLSNSGVVSVALLFVVVGPLTSLPKVKDLIEWCISAPSPSSSPSSSSEEPDKNEESLPAGNANSISSKSKSSSTLLLQRIYQSHAWALLKVCFLCMILSAFVNNTPLVAMMTPIVKNYCRERNISPAQFLMSINGACLIGGTLSVIGTSTNLVFDSFMRTTDLGAMPFFEMTKISAPCCVFALLYLIFAPPYLLPTQTGGLFRLLRNNASSFVGQFMILPNSPLVGGSSSKTNKKNKKKNESSASPRSGGVTVGEFEKLLPAHLQSNLKLVEIVRFDANHNILGASSAMEPILIHPEANFITGGISITTTTSEVNNNNNSNTSTRTTLAPPAPTEQFLPGDILLFAGDLHQLNAAARALGLKWLPTTNLTSSNVPQTVSSFDVHRMLFEDSGEIPVPPSVVPLTTNSINKSSRTDNDGRRLRQENDDDLSEMEIVVPNNNNNNDDDDILSPSPTSPIASPRSMIFRALTNPDSIDIDDDDDENNNAILGLSSNNNNNHMTNNSTAKSDTRNSSKKTHHQDVHHTTKQQQQQSTAATSSIDFVEVVLSHENPCIGRSVGSGIFQKQYGVSVLALRPYGTRPAADLPPSAASADNDHDDRSKDNNSCSTATTKRNDNIQNDLIGHRLACHLFGVGDTVLIVGSTSFLDRFPTHFFVASKCQDSTEEKQIRQARSRLRVSVPWWFPWGISTSDEQEEEEKILPDDVLLLTKSKETSIVDNPSSTDRLALLDEPHQQNSNDSSSSDNDKTKKSSSSSSSSSSTTNKQHKVIILPEWYPYLTVLIFLVMMITAVSGIDIVICASVAVAVLVLIKILTVKEAIASIEFETVIMVAFSLGLGNALKNSGLADVVGYLIRSADIRGFPLLMMIAVTTSFLTNVISSKACASTMFPIIYSTYTQIGVNPLGCVAMSAVLSSVALCTPYAFATNIIVMGPSGCGPVDFVKFGLPLNVIMLILCPTITATVYGQW